MHLSKRGLAQHLQGYRFKSQQGKKRVGREEKGEVGEREGGSREQRLVLGVFKIVFLFWVVSISNRDLVFCC